VPGLLSWINQQIDGTQPASPINYGWEFPPPSHVGVATGVSNVQGYAYSTAGTISRCGLSAGANTFSRSRAAPSAAT
jgi:hypothetical protein